MFFRIFIFLLFQLGGALGGYFFWPDVHPFEGAAVGVACSSLVWVLLDMRRGIKFLDWLRIGDSSEVPVKLGLWGEVADRARRLIRGREQQTRDSDARLQDFLAALQVSPNGVLLLDSYGRIEWFNQMAAVHFGLDARRDLLQHFVNLVREPGFANYLAASDYSRDITMPGRGNTVTRPVRLSVQLHPYGDGRRLLLSRDITALEQAEAMRRDFVANVSHEIRTPLTVLSGFVETLQTLALTEDQREKYLDLMAQQSLRMQSLVNDLLTLSRLEGSPLPGVNEWVAMDALMPQLEQDARALSEALGQGGAVVHQVTLDAVSGIQVAGSFNELLSATSNLVSNAIRYTPSGGVVRIKLQWLGDERAEFSVTDNGPGIAPELLPRLTERFYRVDRSRSRDTGGTGLGLAIVKHVAQRHGAELKIQSMPGQGSTFSIVFTGSRVRANPALSESAVSAM